MTRGTLILRSLRFHARSHLGVVLGAAVGSAALVGALVVGDSVRLSLRDMALQRLGAIEAAMAPADRYFLADLARRLGADFAPALSLPGVATRQDGTARAGRVNVIGVDETFASLAGEPAGTTAIGRLKSH